MKHSLDTYIFAIFAMILAGVLAVGGASLFLVNRMMEKTYAIEAESRNVDFISHLHNKTYNLMLAIHHFMVRPGELQFQRAMALSAEIDSDLMTYLEHEETSAYPEGAEEIRLLGQFRDSVRKQRDTVATIKALGVPAGRNVDVWSVELDRNAETIQFLAREINRLHFDIITRKVAKTRHSMSAVVGLYLVFSGIGLALFYAGYRMHSRHIVDPIKQLARCSGKVADGDLSVRAQSNSQTEIGALYRSFNEMVATLQSHEQKLVEFNSSLEQKVEDRTRELEAVQAKILRLEKLAMLGQIATSVNHEIRTPLNALYLNLQMIGKSLGEPDGEAEKKRDEIRGRLALIDREISRISDILEEFVLFARIAPPQPGECDLNGIATHVAELLEPRTIHTGIKLRLDLAESAPRLYADENKLVQAIVNLGVNAIHAMPEGGILTLSTADRGAWVEITVSDTGMGIAEADMANIFLPFFSRKESGLGFGLAIVQRIVEDHGGRIECQSQVGKGATFAMRLPKSHPVEAAQEHDPITADS